MSKTNSGTDSNKKEPFDLSEEASKRPGGESATTAARQAENDDVTINSNGSSAEDDFAGENRISTSLSDD